MNEMIIAAVAAAVVLVLSAVAAHRTVNRNPRVCVQEKDQNADVLLDDICKKYLRLTNVE